LSFISTTSAESIAISVPLDIDTPISAVTKLTLSFIPSPHIMTKPFCFSFLISSAFCFGNTFAITFSIPNCLAIAFAVFSLSPVSIITSIFLFLSFSTIFLLSSFIVSFTPINAIIFWSFATYNMLFPSVTNSVSSSSFSICILFSFISFLFPIK